VNLTLIAQSLEGYTGSDIKEVCREAVVRVAHERALQQEQGQLPLHPVIPSTIGADPLAGTNTTSPSIDFTNDSDNGLRAVSASDFKAAISKLKASVDDQGREMQKVQEWNDKYGEVKQTKRRSKPHVSMYI